MFFVVSTRHSTKRKKSRMTVKKLCLSLTTFCAAVQINWIYYAFANLIT